MTRSTTLVPAVLALALSACPPLTPEPLEAAPRITSFTASQQQVAPGEVITLRWETEGATAVTLEDLALGQVSGVEDTSGFVSVTVSKSTTYVLTARNTRGATHRAVVSVTTTTAEEAVLLAAMPLEIDAGDPVSLVWSAPGAGTVNITSPAGSVDLKGQLTSGVVTVRPTVTTVYTLVAGLRTAVVTVVVRPTILSFTSSTDAIDIVDGGASVTLSWTTASATQVQVRAPARAALFDSRDAGTMVASGSVTDVLPVPVDPSRRFVYELVVTGAAGTTSQQLSLPVRGAPSITSVSAPRYAKAGTPVTVSWVTAGADALSVLQGGVEIYRASSAAAVASGSVDVLAPPASVTFEVVATGGLAEAREAVEVEVVGLPSVSLSTTPAVVARGAPFQLTWSGQSVRNVTVYGPDGRVLFTEADVSDTGTVPTMLRLGDSATYRITADNALGDVASASTTVTVGSPFTLTPSLTGSVPAGQRVELAWTGGETLYGLAHDAVQVRTSSTGFDDISTTGTTITFSSSDDGATAILTPFRAPFYGRLVGEEIWVSTNGYLTFGPADRSNYVDVPLPSAKLEPLTLAPYWEDLRMASGSVEWQVKTVGPDEVLIVQWTNAGTLSPTTSNTFQVKLWSTGQVDFEYQTFVAVGGQAGIQGPRGDEGLLVPTPPVTGLGVTFFAPVTSPAGVIARSRAPVGAFLKVNGNYVPVSRSLDVVRPQDLHLAEALLEPAAAVGPDGRWLEFYNARETAIDLTGWALALSDGGTSALSGSVPPRGVRVFGLSVDPALNDDAGVQAAIAPFAGTPAGSFDWGRGGAFGTWSWNNPTTGVSVVNDRGPYRLSTDVTATPSHPQVCVGTAQYGSQSPRQKGTPGADVACGFGYGWAEAPFGYYDISGSGTKLIANTTSSTQVNVELGAAPFPFFGVPRSAVRISPEGYLTFDLAAATNTFSTNYPSTSAPNSVIAVFADDMGGRRADSGVFFKRVAAGEDPFAAAPHWIVQWHRWSHVTDDDLNFQVKLFDDGVMELHFATMTSGASSTPYGSGLSSNTWVENAGGTQALVINASSVDPGISPFTAFRVSPR